MHYFLTYHRPEEDQSHSHVEPNIFVQGTRLEMVDYFVYLCSTRSREGSFDSEINLRIEKASQVFGKIKNRKRSDRGITIEIKMRDYESCVLSTCLYPSET